MSVTTEAKSRPATKRRTRSAEGPTTGVEAGIAPPPKLRRRPLLVVVSVAAVCFGGLLGVWAYTSVTTAEDVVAVRSTIQRGALNQPRGSGHGTDRGGSCAQSDSGRPAGRRGGSAGRDGSAGWRIRDAGQHHSDGGSGSGHVGGGCRGAGGAAAWGSL
jgi:hypothetical protein